VEKIESENLQGLGEEPGSLSAFGNGGSKKILVEEFLAVGPSAEDSEVFFERLSGVAEKIGGGLGG